MNTKDAYGLFSFAVKYTWTIAGFLALCAVIGYFLA